jgi:hypothetical protein
VTESDLSVLGTEVVIAYHDVPLDEAITSAWPSRARSDAALPAVMLPVKSCTLEGYAVVPLGVAVGETVGAGVGEGVGVLVAVAVFVGVAVAVEVCVGEAVAVAVAVGVTPESSKLPKSCDQ